MVRQTGRIAVGNTSESTVPPQNSVTDEPSGVRDLDRSAALAPAALAVAATLWALAFALAILDGELSDK